MREEILEKAKKHQTLLLTILAGLIGAIIFIAIYGIIPLDVTNATWIPLDEDLTQHYFGWEFFRNSGWTFPIGMFDKLSYPNYQTIILTDCIPLFAIFFKTISFILPETFQYLGIFGLMCYVLQGVFSFTLLRRFINNKFVAIMRIYLFHNISIYTSKNV